MYSLSIFVIFLIIIFFCFRSRVDGYEDNVFCLSKNGPCYKGKDQVRCIQVPSEGYGGRDKVRCIRSDYPCNIYERALEDKYITDKEYTNIMKHYGEGHPCSCKTCLCDQLWLAMYNGLIDPDVVKILLEEYDYECPNLNFKVLKHIYQSN
jgi:hypothetical protein